MGSSALSPAAAGELSSRRKSLVLAICCISMVVVVMDISIVNVALPAIRSDVHGGLAQQQWIVEAYLLSLSSLILVGGSIGDLLGRRRLFFGGSGRHGTGGKDGDDKAAEDGTGKRTHD